MKAAGLGIEVATASLVLLGARAALVPRAGALLVADVHLGKAASFGARGIPVPDTTEPTLARLGALVEGHGVQALYVLGDLLHGIEAHRSGVVDRLARWRERHPKVRCVLVRGNHDDRAGDPPPECGFELLDEPAASEALPGLALRHTPTDAPDAYVLAGHLHPAFGLSGRADRLRLPCFWVRPGHAVLPAFGDFTGGFTVRPQPGDRLYLADGERVHPVPLR